MWNFEIRKVIIVFFKMNESIISNQIKKWFEWIFRWHNKNKYIEYVLTWWWLACWVSPVLSWGGGGGGGLVLGRRGDAPPFVGTFAGARGIDGPTYPPEKSKLFHFKNKIIYWIK